MRTQLEQHLQSLRVLSPPYLFILSIIQLKFPNIIFFFIYLIFIFHIILQSFKETPPSQLFPITIPCMGISVENSGERSNLKGHKPPFWISSVSTSVMPLITGWSSTSKPFVWLSPGEKTMGPNQLFLICIWWCICSWLIWVSVKIMMSLGFFSAKLKWQTCFKRSLMPPTLLYHAVTIEKSESKSFLFQFHVFSCN